MPDFKKPKGERNFSLRLFNEVWIDWFFRIVIFTMDCSSSVKSGGCLRGKIKRVSKYSIKIRWNPFLILAERKGLTLLFSNWGVSKNKNQQSPCQAGLSSLCEKRNQSLSFFTSLRNPFLDCWFLFFAESTALSSNQIYNAAAKLWALKAVLAHITIVKSKKRVYAEV